jgi:hypothetical protein
MLALNREQVVQREQMLNLQDLMQYSLTKLSIKENYLVK